MLGPTSAGATLRRRLAIALAVLAATAASASEQAVRVVVTDDVVAPALGPFAATLARTGEGSSLLRSGGGFEPVVHRASLRTVADGSNRIVAVPGAITAHGTLREGALDGATADVYRVENGVLRRVRRGRVAEGGHAASGWFEQVPARRMLARETTQFAVRTPGFHRPDAALWLSVRAVSRSGALSDPATPARVIHRKTERRGRARDEAGADGPALVRRPDPEGAAGAPAAPAGLSVETGRDGLHLLRWDPPRDPDVAGYVVLLSETDPAAHRGFHLDLEPDPGAAPIRAGDWVVLSKRLLEGSRRTMSADRVWGAGSATRGLRPGLVDVWPDEDPAVSWRLVPHGAAAPQPDAGETYLELTLGPGARERVGAVNHAGVEQDFYDVLGPWPYRFSAWLRADPPARVALRFVGPYEGAVRPVVFDVDQSWRRVETEFVPPRLLTDRRPGSIALEFEGPGRFDVDDVRLHRADTPYLDWSAEDRARMAASGMALLRTHPFVKTGHASYDLKQLTNAGGAVEGITGRNTLPQVLRLMESVGADPWLQIEPHFSPEEWRGLVEYLAAPFDPARDDPAALPWAAKRHAQGRAAPWTDAFDRIVFELGNETWNRIMSPWTFHAMPDAATGETLSSGTVYGLAVEHMIASMRESPHWTASGLDDKAVFALGGWRRRPAFGLDAARAAPNAQWLTVASYNGGWDEGEGPAAPTPEGFFAILNQVSQVTIPLADRLAEGARRAAAARGTPLALGSYEGGPGYAHSGLNGAQLTAAEIREQEEAMKSQAGAVATLDSFLAQAERGFVAQNFFTFSPGPRWSSHAHWHKGGGDYAPWRVLGLFNRVGPGDMLRVAVRGAPVEDLPATRRAEAVSDAPQIAAYATRKGRRVTVALISRRLPGYPNPASDGFTPVELALPFARAARLTLHRMAGPHDAHDVDGRQVEIETVPLAVPDLGGPVAVDAALGADARGLPPASALIYVFEGVEGVD